MITKLTLSGILTSEAPIYGLKSIKSALFLEPMMEAVWSIPPQAVPAILSAVIESSASFSFGIISYKPLACIATIAAQTVIAALELSPTAIGTLESMYIFKPFGYETIALSFSS